MVSALRSLVGLGAVAFFAAPVLAQTGAVAGGVTNGAGVALPGASVQVLGTGIGTAADLGGWFRLASVPAGPVRIVVSFVGYAADTLVVDVAAGATARLDVTLTPVTVDGEPVVVSAQLGGQLAALNRRRASATLVDVVAADRIRALPDATAAEAVGRRPGVGLQRDGAEGLKARLRGLDPTFAAVSLDGERIPATDPRDRSVDLSLVPADLLEAIEVVKALTPDRDADGIGGAVDLIVSSAPDGRRAELRAEGGYASLRDEVGDGRVGARLSDRFWNGRLGAVLTADFQSEDRSFDALTDDFGGGLAAVRSQADIEVVDERHQRAGAGLALDLDTGDGGGLTLSGLYVRTDRDQTQQRTRYRVAQGDLERSLRTREVALDLGTLALRGDHALGGLRLGYGASVSRATNRRPDGFEVAFRQTAPGTTGGGGGAGGGGGGASPPPSLYGNGAATDPIEVLVASTELLPENTGLVNWRRGRRASEDRDWTAHVDLAAPLRIGGLAVELRGGAKLRDKRREQDGTRSELLGAAVPGLSVPTLSDIGQAEGLSFVGTRVAVAPFLGGGPGASALNGRLGLGAPLDATALGALDGANADAFVVNPYFDRNDFEASETVSAAFGLADVTAGPLRVVGGLRAEHTRTAYTGRTGDLNPSLVQQLRTDPTAAVRDTSGSSSYTHLFPQVVARLHVAGLDVRAAATRSLARPDFSDLVVRENVDDVRLIVERGTPDVRPVTAWNLDLSVARIGPAGLVGVVVFAKRLDDYFYDTTVRLEDGPLAGYQLIETVNGDAARVWGGEVEAQVHFAFLPGPLSGLLASANLTATSSTAEAPVQLPDRVDEAGVVRTRTETRKGPLPGLSPLLANWTLGYERGGFRGRLSLSHRGATQILVSVPTFAAEVDGSGALVVTETTGVGIETRPLTRLDVQVSQALPVASGRQLRLIGGLSNALAGSELDVRSTGEIVGERAAGLTVSFGLRLDL